MPIQVKKDIKRRYNLGSSFSLKDIPNFKSGSVLNRVRADIADQNWDDFYKSWNFVFPLNLEGTKRNVIKALAKRFNLKASEEEIFDELWKIAWDADQFKKDQETDIETDVEKAYQHVAKIAGGEAVNKKTFDRITDKVVSNASSFVVFSDFHMTAFKSKPNYFKDYNYQLYLDVLRHYATTDFHLVENGDVEECLIYEPTLRDAQLRTDQAPGKSKFPITSGDDKWTDFLATRYSQRLDNLNGVIEEFEDYYNLIRTSFISDNRYTRIAGNHDTYLNEAYERDLRDRIQEELGVNVYDILRISQSNTIKYLILHGHQFDTVCMQHGSIPFAKSLGEVYSECLSWAFQGPDRAWTLQDTKKWYIGNSYNNVLAKEEHGKYQDGTTGEFDLVFEALNRIKEDSKDFVETLLGHEIAWEYFENTNGFEALALEVWPGEELYKMRHMNEVALCERYASEFLNLHNPPDFSSPVPTLVLGHTHEPRKNAVFPNSQNAPPYYYLNSGSAGRYENLIWCVEITGEEDRICSWSRVNGQLKKITWKSEGNKLVHDVVDMMLI